MINQTTKTNQELLNKKFEKFNPEGDDIGLLKLDSSLFAYFFFKDAKKNRFKVFTYQDVIINDKSNKICVCIARQTGKSTMAAIYAIHSAFFNDEFTILVISATIKQSTELIHKMKNLLRTGSFTIWKEISGDVRESKSEIHIKNRGGKSSSRIISLPATEMIRGFTADLVIVDEAAFIENGDYIFNQVIEPTTQYTKGKIMLFSTPNGKQGFFYRCFNSSYWSSYQFDWRVCPNNTEEEMIEKQQRMTNLQFQSEYEAKFVDMRDSYFPSSLVERCISEDIGGAIPTGSPVILGVDFGKVHDNCVINIGVVENPMEDPDKWIIVLYQRIVKPLGTDYAAIVSELKDLIRKYNAKIFLDATGVGEGPSDFIIKSGVTNKDNIVPIYFSLKTKTEIMANLKLLFEQNRIKIPNETELINQLECMQYEYLSYDKLKIHHPEGGHDDEVDALALMAYGFSMAAFPVPNIEFVSKEEVKPGVRQLFYCNDCNDYFYKGEHNHYL